LLLLVIAQATYFLNNQIQIDLFKFLPQFFHLSLWECLEEFFFIEVYDFAICGTSYPAPSFNPEEHFFMAEDSSRFNLSKFVLEAAASFHDLPGLIADWVLAEFFDLNDRLNNHSSLLKYVEDLRILANVENNIIWLILHFVKLQI
jgi:hypothetical protein